MKIINSKLHGVLDYLVSFVLIISPWALGFTNHGIQSYLPVILGASSILYSLMTNYEFGAFKIFSFKTHLFFDALSGVLLATSPWIFGFAKDVYTPYLVFGILEIVVVLLTNSGTSNSSNLKTSTP